MATDLIAAILAAIRSLESGGDYTARNATSTASGAYQFTDPTWRAVGGAAYAPRAYLATPAQQDAVAAAYVAKILSANGGRLEAVPRTWYVGDPNKPDSYLPPGNKLTVGQYVAKWLSAYRGPQTAAGVDPPGDWTDKGGGPGGWIPTPGDVPTPSDAAGWLADALGAAVEPFVTGLRRISIIGITVLGGVALVVAGTWRGVKASG